jgi:hypothetical protein
MKKIVEYIKTDIYSTDREGYYTDQVKLIDPEEHKKNKLATGEIYLAQ